MTVNCEFCEGACTEPGFDDCAWCDNTGIKAGLMSIDPGKPGSDMTATAVFSREGDKLRLLSLAHSEPKVCAASLGGVHCQASRANGSLFCARHRHASNRMYLPRITNESLAFMMQRDGEQQ
jgi:hypothetical protein